MDEIYQIQGSHTKAEVFGSDLDDVTIGQITQLCNTAWLKDHKIAIMPDAHMGKGCTIGTTIQLQDKVAPALIGVDIGCGVSMLVLKVEDVSELDLEAIDRTMRRTIPTGMTVHQKALKEGEDFVTRNLKDLKIYKQLSNISRITASLGTLGGGNHYCEIGKIDDQHIALFVHSGSRNLGTQVAKHYQKVAENYMITLDKPIITTEEIEAMKKAGNAHLINEEIQKRKALQTVQVKVPKDLSYIEGYDYKNYLNDMGICQNYAATNRHIMVYAMKAAIEHTGTETEVVEFLDTVHNYIDLDTKIARKGAIRANQGDKVVIPINMRDGHLIAIGKGNANTNYSGPHGAGRKMSRSEAKDKIDFDTFKEQMEGIVSSSVKISTLDEAPDAYKSIDVILEDIKASVDVVQIVKPLLNFKATSNEKSW